MRGPLSGLKGCAAIALTRRTRGSWNAAGPFFQCLVRQLGELRTRFRRGAPRGGTADIRCKKPIRPKTFSSLSAMILVTPVAWTECRESRARSSFPSRRCGRASRPLGSVACRLVRAFVLLSAPVQRGRVESLHASSRRGYRRNDPDRGASRHASVDLCQPVERCDRSDLEVRAASENVSRVIALVLSQNAGLTPGRSCCYLKRSGSRPYARAISSRRCSHTSGS